MLLSRIDGRQIIGKHKKRRDVGTNAAQRHTVGDRGHDMFANSKMKILAAEVVAAEMTGAFGVVIGFVRASQIGRATNEEWESLRRPR